jgi:hypothetical protein
VVSWHAQFLTVIGTSDLAVTVTDFFNGWTKVRLPHGEIMESIVNSIDAQAPLPDGIVALGYGDAGNQLVRFCVALQEHQGNDPFFISARVAGQLLGVHFTDASKILSALVGDGALKLVSKGSGNVASRYRYGWSQ